MSKKEQITVTCPGCGSEHPFTVWLSINTVMDPGMKAAVKDGSAFRFTCPDCGKTTTVDHSCLYHQMEDCIMIHYASTDEDADNIYRTITEKDPVALIRNYVDNEYLIRIVRSLNELREKISIFDAGLDDRIVEMCKLIILSAYQNDHPESSKAEALFYRDGEKNMVQIIADNETKGLAEIPADLYDKVSGHIMDMLPAMREDGLFIDRAWALGSMNLLID